MKKQKVCFTLRRYNHGYAKYIIAKRDYSFEDALMATLLLDELAFHRNKQSIDQAIDEAIQAGDEATFNQLAQAYRHYYLD
ncbi:hypothetical protein HMI01_23530 [Halolactibacillus miurensis]|uniref:IDEAL domain-containing protein n=1 Tax=Halolactibacillus miurensis TaxID=306541 RepID=A0A1I6ULZ1_9BACI|nr:MULTISPECIES: IDEAL domain-containing protein [Halolactibacillus]GEM05365.1 hypothetical protein HMI01_23530 [Halolactibacillus miurensis]SFT02462.1 IDEAL domain-containing protein [Halolactibacillus miurensis]